ncbi:MAG TPA: OsmC family protein [Terriglobales bacterium]|nr:OsmC family protein [Terriglobales bacterium]
MKEHTYKVGVTWIGNDGEGTKGYRSYRRDHVIEVVGKQPIAGSSDPVFRGDPTRHNPEDLLVASLSACHMLMYLHLCAVNRVNVVAYTDAASGIMREKPDGAGEFASVQLMPTVTISSGSDPAKAEELHHQAHEKCFIANSVKFPVEVTPEIVLENEQKPEASVA